MKQQDTLQKINNFSINVQQEQKLVLMELSAYYSLAVFGVSTHVFTRVITQIAWTFPRAQPDKKSVVVDV